MQQGGASILSIFLPHRTLSMETAGGTKRSLPPVTVDDVCDFLASVLSGRAGAMHLNDKSRLGHPPKHCWQFDLTHKVSTPVKERPTAGPHLSDGGSLLTRMPRLHARHPTPS